jgi:large subunit ribosomal protein L10
MSKYVKNLITTDLTKRFGDVDGVAVLNPRGIDANKNHAIRRKLHDKGLRMTVVKNTLAKRATQQSKLKGFEKLLDGPSAVIYGKASIADIARTLQDIKKDMETLELRGIFFDGEIYPGEDGVKQVSKLPTREEAIGQLVALILSPGKNLAAALKGPGSKLGSVLKTIEEKGKAAESAAPEASAPEAAAPEAAAPEGAAPATA